MPHPASCITRCRVRAAPPPPIYEPACGLLFHCTVVRNTLVKGEGEGSWYTILRGDSLGRIASSHGCQLNVLAAVNQIGNPSVIRVGTRLWIPAQCAVLDALASTFVPAPTATLAMPVPPTPTKTSTPVAALSPVSTPTPIPPAPTPTSVPVLPTPTSTSVSQLPATSQTGYQCTVDPYQPPPRPTSGYIKCGDFSSRAEFDQHYGGSFYPGHDRDKDCIPCESLN